MSIQSKNGAGNLLISYLFQSSDVIGQVDEEQKLKNDLARFMHERGYRKFVIADDEFINEKVTKGCSL